MRKMRIRNWERFQHYKNRNPPWIKLHVLVLDDFDWIKWNNDTKVLAVSVMLLAARTENEVPWDRDYLAAVTHVDVTKDAMNVLDLCRFVVPLDKNDSELLADASELHRIACPETETETDTEKKKKARNRAVFVKPEITEVAEYCGERNNTVSADAFVSYYESNGWRVGRNPMKDWKAAVRTWEKRNEKPNGTSGKPVFEQPHERRARELDEALARAEGAAGVEADAGDLRGQVLEGVWSRAE